MKSRIIIADKEVFAAFKKECTVLSLEKEYPGYTGEEKYLILTDLSKETLYKKYSSILNGYEPYIVDSTRLCSPIKAYHKNDDKFSKRHTRNTISIEVNSDDEQTFSSLQADDYLTVLIAKADKEELCQAVKKALKKLPEGQRRRLIMWALDKKTLEEIAAIEGITKSMAGKSVQTAKRNFAKNLDKRLTFGTPLSKEDEGIIDGE